MRKEDYMISDEELLVQFSSGDTQSGGILYERYKGILFSYFFHNCKNRERSEDLVQKTFEKIIRYREKFSGSGSFKSWMFSIARNAFKDDYVIHQKHYKIKETQSNHSYERADGFENYQLLEACLEKLSKEQRELLIMTKLKGMKYEEVGNIYGLTVTNVKTKVFRIMKELRAYRAILLQENLES